MIQRMACAVRSTPPRQLRMSAHMRGERKAVLPKSSGGLKPYSAGHQKLWKRQAWKFWRRELTLFFSQRWWSARARRVAYQACAHVPIMCRGMLSGTVMCRGRHLHLSRSVIKKVHD